MCEVLLTDQDEFMVMACDGLWDVCTPQQVCICAGLHVFRAALDSTQAVEYVHGHMVEAGAGVEGAAQGLVDLALSRGVHASIHTCIHVSMHVCAGSTDNITVQVIYFSQHT